MEWLIRAYDRMVIDGSRVMLGVVFVALAFCLYHVKGFELDASSESLVLENDQDLNNYREVLERYGTSEFVFVTYRPKEPLFSAASLETLKSLRDKLVAVSEVESVNSILDVPLLQNPPVPVVELVQNIKTLESPDVDLILAQLELSTSPIYQNLLVNLDDNIAALAVNFPADDVYRDLVNERRKLWDMREYGVIREEESQRLDELNKAIRDRNTENAAKFHAVIQTIRDIIEDYQEDAEVYLGGVPMIADDMITFVENDLAVFSIGVLLFLIITLMVLFQRVQWVGLAISICTLVVVMMVGVLGLMEWRVTVISSNFMSLLLVITMSMTIHLIVRYREFFVENPDWTQKQLVEATLRRIFLPCLYTALTTIVAFSSLVLSGIRPVIDFGWIMATGVALALVVAFIIFPAVVSLLPKGQESSTAKTKSPFTNFMAYIATRFGKVIVALNIVLALYVVMGVSRLVVENSFINYFHDSTEIYQGMKTVDQSLGGTTPLEIIIRFPDESAVLPVDPVVTNEDELASADDEFGEEEFDEFEEDEFSFDDDTEEEDPAKYWFTTDKVEKIRMVHEYLDERSETGKVLSLNTMITIAEQMNDGESFDNFQLALLYSAIPAEFKSIVLDPYVSPENNQARISIRMIDSDPNLKRAEFLEQVAHDLEHKLGLKPDEFMLAGMMVLYNNMLQSLFESQILTLGAVFIGIMAMFLVLFRSIKISIIAIIPNLLASGVVLGVMGWAGIPLDMMTITIAAIAIGIAVDNTIHYIYRYRIEFEKDRDYKAAIGRCHGSIGRAVYYTSFTIIAGFSILALSNFIPTIVFGLLTSLSMAIALIQVLTFLPQLLVIFKPFGPGADELDAEKEAITPIEVVED